MTSPKRAEPANEHAERLRLVADLLERSGNSIGALGCEKAAAEIERLQAEVSASISRNLDLCKSNEALTDEIERLAARVRELQEALTMKAFCEPEVTVIPRSDRPWLPIEGAPRDGTRVELWHQPVSERRSPFPEYGRYRENSKKWVNTSGDFIRPTHWRPEPAGPESKPDQETKGER